LVNDGLLEHDHGVLALGAGADFCAKEHAFFGFYALGNNAYWHGCVVVHKQTGRFACDWQRSRSKDHGSAI
jgi:hypothetical protein